MTKSKKITVAITVSILLLLGFIFFQLVLTDLVSERFKEPLSRKLGQWVNKDVLIGQLKTNIFNSLTINGLTIYQPGNREEGPILEVREIAIRYNIWRLLKTRDFSRSIMEIVLFDPTVHLRYRQGQWNLNELMAKNLSPGRQLPYSLNINNGRISFHNEPGSLDQVSVNKIYGTVKPKTKTQISFRFKAITSLSQNDRLNIAGTYAIPQAVVEAEISGKKISLQKIPQVFPSLQLSTAQGEMSIKMSLHYDTLSQDGFSCQGTATLQEAEFKLVRVPDPVRDLSCTLEFDEKNINVRKSFFALANSSYLVSGSISDFLRQPVADLKLKAAAFDLSDLSRIFSSQDLHTLNLAGKGRLTLAITGPLPGIKIISDLAMTKGHLQGSPLKDLKFQAVWQHNLLTINTCQARLAGGDLAVSAKIKLGTDLPLEIYELNASGLHLNLEQLFKNNFSGSMDTYITVKGIWPEVDAQGRIMVKKFSFAGYDLGPGDASFQYRQHNLSFSGLRLNTKDTIRGLVRFKEKLVQIDNLGIAFANGGNLGVQGEIQTSKGQPILLNLTGKNMPVEELSSLLGLSNLHGTVNSHGKIHGTLTAPAAQLTISGSELLAGAHKIVLAGNCLITREKLEFPELKINHDSKIKGTITFKPKPLVDLNFQPVNLELGILLSVVGFDSGGELNGLSTGYLNLNGVPGALEARGNFKIEALQLWNLVLGTAQSTVVFSQKKIFQGTISTLAKNGTLQGSWWVDLQKDKENKAEVIFDFDRFQSIFPGTSYETPQLDGRIKYAGWLKYNGQTAFSGKLSSESLTINKQPQEITGQISSQKKQIILKAQMGKAYILETTVLLQDQPRIKGSLHIGLDNIAQANTMWQVKGLEKMTGPLRIEADITGTLNDPVIKGSLAGGRGIWRGVSYDQITGLWRCQASILHVTNLEFKKGPEEYLAAGKIPFNAESPWWFNIQVNQADFANLVQLVTDPGETKGQVQAEVKITGNRQNPLVSGTILVHDFSYAGLAPSEISCEFKIKNRIITFDTLRAETKEGKLYLEKGSTVTLQEQEDIAFNCQLGLRNIKLNQVVFFGDLAISGKKENCSILVKNLWVNQHQYSGEKIALNWQDEKIEFLPSANKEKLITGTIFRPAKQEYVFDNIALYTKGQAVVNASGKIKYPHQVSLAISTQNQGVMAGTVAELLDLKIPVTGRALFNLEIQGRWTNPEIDCSFQCYEGKISGLDYNSFKGEFVVKDGLLTLAGTELRGNKRYKVQAKGTIPLKEQGDYNLKISLPDSSCELLGFWPEYIKKARGPLAAEVTVTGKKSNPVFNGICSIDGGELYPARIVKKITAAQVRLRIIDNKINIGSCSAAIGDATLAVAGYVDLGISAPGDFDLTINAGGKRGMQVAIPGFIERGEIKGEMHAFGQFKDYQLAGNITLANTHLTYPPKKSAAGLSSADWLDYAHWNLTITGGENTWYENELVEVNVQGHLVFTGPSDLLNISGRVEAVRGTLQYLGNDFRIREAALDFYNNTAYVAGTAEAQVAQDMVIFTVNKNKLDDVRPRFTSRNDPQMSEQKVISMLVYGPEINELSGEEQSKVLLKEMLKLVDTTLNTRVIKPVVKNLGLDRVIDVVRIRTEVTQHSAESTTGPAWKGSSVSIGKYLGSRVFLGYNTILEEELNSNKLALKHQVELDYHLKGSKYLKMRIDEKERFMGIENQIKF